MYEATRKKMKCIMRIEMDTTRRREETVIALFENNAKNN